MIHIFHRGILYKTPEEASGSMHLHITADGFGGCNVRMKNYSEKEGEINVNPSSLKDGWTVSVYYNVSSSQFVVFKDSYSRRDADAFMRMHNFANFCFSMMKFEGDFYVLPGIPVLVDMEADVRLVSHQKSTLRVIEEFNPRLGEHPNVKRRRARYDLLYNINHIDSLADLEKHVDLLTDLVMQIAKLIPEEARPQLAAKMEEITAHSSLTQKSEDELLADVVKQKSHIRSILAKYYPLKKESDV